MERRFSSLLRVCIEGFAARGERVPASRRPGKGEREGGKVMETREGVKRARGRHGEGRANEEGAACIDAFLALCNSSFLWPENERSLKSLRRTFTSHVAFFP